MFPQLYSEAGYESQTNVQQLSPVIQNMMAPWTAGSSLNVQKVKFSSLRSTKSGDVLLENWSNPVSVVPMAMVPWRSLLQALAEGLSLTSEETILRRSGRFIDGETLK